MDSQGRDIFVSVCDARPGGTWSWTWYCDAARKRLLMMEKARLVWGTFDLERSIPSLLGSSQALPPRQASPIISGRAAGAVLGKSHSSLLPLFRGKSTVGVVVRNRDKRQPFFCAIITSTFLERRKKERDRRAPHTPCGFGIAGSRSGKRDRWRARLGIR